jgi:hypothetical protein
MQGKTGAGRGLKAAGLAVAVAVVFALPAGAGARSLKPTHLTLSGPTTVPAGGKIALSGYLTNPATGRRIRNGIITIYYATPGAASWTALNSVRTSASGYYADTVTVHSTVYFSALFRQVSGFRGARTGSLKVTVPAVANGALEWGSDWCLYEGVSGRWQGQWCIRQAANSAGQALANQYWVFAFNPSVVSHLGNALFIWDPALSNNNYFVVRAIPNQPADIAWIAVPLQPNAQGLFDAPVNGQYKWLTAAQFRAYYQAGEIGTVPSASTTTVTIGGPVPAAFQQLVNGSGANGVLGQLEAESGGGNSMLNTVIAGYDQETLTDLG